MGRAPARGDIWIVDFSPARGSEQAGKRPALVVQNDVGNRNERYPNTIVLAMSTKSKPVPFHIMVMPNRATGLREVTYIKAEQVLTISKTRLLGGRPIGRITPEQIRKVEVALLLSLGVGSSSS